MLSSTIARQCGDGADVGDGQPVAGVDLEPDGVGRLRRPGEPPELAVDVARRGGVRVVAGVELDGVGAGGLAGPDLRVVGVDERGDPDARLGEASHGRADPGLVGGHVESALGRELLPSLGHQADVVGPHAAARRRPSRPSRPSPG